MRRRPHLGPPTRPTTDHLGPLTEDFPELPRGQLPSLDGKRCHQVSRPADAPAFPAARQHFERVSKTPLSSLTHGISSPLSRLYLPHTWHPRANMPPNATEVPSKKQRLTITFSLLYIFHARSSWHGHKHHTPLLAGLRNTGLFLSEDSPRGNRSLCCFGYHIGGIGRGPISPAVGLAAARTLRWRPA